MNFFQESLRTLEEYKNPRRLLSSKVSVFGVLILSLAVGYKTLGIVMKERALNREIKKLEEQVKKLEESNDLLDKEISRTHTPEIIERLAKEQLNLRKPGEIVAVRVTSTSTPEPAEPPKPSFWEYLKSLFGF